jgi:hypothetical protein
LVHRRLTGAGVNRRVRAELRAVSLPGFGRQSENRSHRPGHIDGRLHRPTGIRARIDALRSGSSLSSWVLSVATSARGNAVDDDTKGARSSTVSRSGTHETPVDPSWHRYLRRDDLRT